MSEIIKYIDEYVKNRINELNSSQVTTLKALVLAGYKGERNYVLEDFLKSMGEEGISFCDLIESFEYSFEDETAVYTRIKPEFFRATRKHLFEK
ncbi:MAG: hypothetical protein ACE5HY_03820 [Candidatus Hydrothermarchaeales archaeon]